MAAGAAEVRARHRRRRRASRPARATRDRRRRAGATRRARHALQARRADPSAAGTGAQSWLRCSRARPSCRPRTTPSRSAPGWARTCGPVTSSCCPVRWVRERRCWPRGSRAPWTSRAPSPRRRSCWPACTRRCRQARPRWCTSTSTGCSTTRVPTCSPSSTPSTWTPISTTPSWSSNGARAWRSGCPTATSTSGSSVAATPTCASRRGSGASRP